MTQGCDGTAVRTDLAPARALAELLPCGVLLVDAQARVELASRRACAMLDAADPAALQVRWDEIRAALGTDAADAPTSVEIVAAGARRRLRVECQRIGAGHSIML